MQKQSINRIIAGMHPLPDNKITNSKFINAVNLVSLNMNDGYKNEVEEWFKNFCANKDEDTKNFCKIFKDILKNNPEKFDSMFERFKNEAYDIIILFVMNNILQAPNKDSSGDIGYREILSFKKLCHEITDAMKTLFPNQKQHGRKLLQMELCSFESTKKYLKKLIKSEIIYKDKSRPSKTKFVSQKNDGLFNYNEDKIKEQYGYDLQDIKNFSQNILIPYFNELVSSLGHLHRISLDIIILAKKYPLNHRIKDNVREEDLLLMIKYTFPIFIFYYKKGFLN